MPRSASHATPGPQPRDAGHVQVTGLVLLGQLVGLSIAIAMRAGPPLAKGRNPVFDRRAECTRGPSPAAPASPCDPARPTDRRAVARRRSRSHRPFERRRAGTGAVIACNRPDLGSRLDHASHVRRVRQRYEPRAGAQCASNFGRIDNACRVAGNAADLNTTSLLQRGQRTQYGIVFGQRRNDVTTVGKRAMNGGVQRVGAIEREDDVLGPLGADPLCDCARVPSTSPCAAMASSYTPRPTGAPTSRMIAVDSR